MTSLRSMFLFAYSFIASSRSGDAVRTVRCDPL